MGASQSTMNVDDVKTETEYGLKIFREKFFNLNTKNKEKYLNFGYVEVFLDALNKLNFGLGNSLKKIFLTAKFPSNWEEIRQEVLKVGGYIGPVLCENPGSFQFMDLLYRCKEPRGPLDRFLMDCHSGIAVDHRKSATIQNIAALLTRMQNGNGNSSCKKKVLNLGSGCGYDTFEISDGSNSISNQFIFINVDIDYKAIAEGEQILQERYPHLRNISFLQKDMLHLKVRNAVVAFIIGVLCGFPQKQCVRNLRIVKSFISPGGIVYGACVTDRMLEDLFTCFVLEYILNWTLCYRKPEDVQAMFEQAGLKWRQDLTFIEEPTEFYVIGAGEVPN